MAVDHNSAGTSARPDSQTSDTITLATNADFAAAETELNRLLTLHRQIVYDVEGDRLAAQWQPIYNALMRNSGHTVPSRRRAAPLDLPRHQSRHPAWRHHRSCGRVPVCRRWGSHGRFPHP